MQPLHTPRLIIRQLVRTDIGVVAEILDACFSPAPKEDRQRWMEWTIRNYEALQELHQPPYGDYAVSLKEVEQVIGLVGLVPSFGPFGKLPGLRAEVHDAPDLFTPEMGLFWAVDPAHQHKGYATEAAGALARFAFEQLRVERLVATTEHTNEPSIAVMRRLGMQIQRNPDPHPPWFQTVGTLFNPEIHQGT